MFRLLKYFGRRSPHILFIGFPVVYLLKTFQGCLDIRIAQIPNRLGHTISSLDFWLTLNQKSTSLGQKGIKKQIFFMERKYLDDEFYRLVARLIPLGSYWFWNPVFEVIHWLGWQDNFVFELVGEPIDEVSGVFKGTKSPLPQANKDVQDRIAMMCNDFDIELDKLVLLCIRDSGYGESISMGDAERIAEYRNSDILRYSEAINLLIDSGFFVVRMGNEHKPLHNIDHSKFVSFSKLSDEYAMEQIDLFQSCSFVISSDTGLNKLAVICRKPLYMLNVGAFTDRFLHDLTHLVLYKKFKSKVSGKELTMGELITKNILKITDSEEFDKRDIVIEENSSEELRLFVSEIIEICNSQWVESCESKRMRERFKRELEFQGYDFGDFAFPNFFARDRKW